MSILHNFISEAIPGQKCHMNLGPFPNGYRDLGMWNVAWLGNFIIYLLKKKIVQFSLQYSLARNIVQFR